MTELRIPLAGVIGSPIAHSKSPQMHQFWLRENGLSGHYVPLHVGADDLEGVLRTLPKMGFVGANVTIPHKERALAIADEVSETAAKIGAANTLVFGADGHIFADNTDAYGFIANLKHGAPQWRASHGAACILGAGGAARAVISALQDEGVDQIYLTNRTQSRAEDLSQEFGGNITVVPWAQAGDVIGDLGVLVNSTSLGMTGKPALEVPLDALQAKTAVTDLVYAPLQTNLLKTASAKGCPTVDGLGMLLHQGVPGFERWFGVRPKVTKALREALLS